MALCSVKGGTGKTTLSFNLAERAHAHGFRALLVDCDVQEASVAIDRMGEQERGWSVLRGAVSHPGLDRVAVFRSSGDYDFVFCDLPGHDSMILPRFLAEMDLVLSPVGVGPTDLVSACGFWFSLQRSDVNLVFVPNSVTGGRGRLRELEEALGEREARVCPVVVRHRVAHMDALRLGLGVCEFAPGSSAAEDMEALWEWLASEVTGNEEHEKRLEVAT